MLPNYIHHSSKNSGKPRQIYQSTLVCGSITQELNWIDMIVVEHCSMLLACCYIMLRC